SPARVCPSSRARHGRIGHLTDAPRRPRAFAGRMRHLILATALLAACGGASPELDVASAGDALERNPTVVDPGIYRSSRPGYTDLAALRAKGVKYILDLENDSSAISQEKKWAAQLGMTFISEQMSGFWTPNDTQVNRILSVLA